MIDCVIGLCCSTENDLRPWAEAGYTCFAVDIGHSIRRDRVEHFGSGCIVFTWGDVRSWYPPSGYRPVFMIAHTPCTQLACSGARDFMKKRGWMLTDGLQMFDSAIQACEYAGVPYYAENPIGRLNTHRRKPDFIFHPWEYAGYLPDIQAENTSKKTCIWTGGGFVVPERNPAPVPHREDCWLAAPDDNRANLRSATPLGWARAVFEANQPLLKVKVA